MANQMYRCTFKVNGVQKQEVVTASSMNDARQIVLRMYKGNQVVFVSCVPV